ncbi:unnamed protein product [Didymodactylos carnosus]|uniref:Coiled-coil domain-containing protein n=1 Tax=Didymodactylos carnosus TaxID=1234261 RepID=A0A813UFD2_9BILA|nr:unnamed protein product [Didymodactylos carnosus]CAF0822956.1 unnamed protein product [Didymodactylos carnosus]CAF3504693.1 unnamed protein product [Didymodactylos carnosus]CAF3609525.1 unnamed protein product [Didymodactylos carnosus]
MLTFTPPESDKKSRNLLVCEQFLIGSDHDMAYRLQQDEFSVHFDRNRNQRRDCRLGVSAAKEVQQEEEKAHVAKQFDFYKEKQIIEENDAEYAKCLQNELMKGPVMNTLLENDVHPNLIRQNSNEKLYESINEDHSIITDEQLARLLQEEEFALSKTNYKYTSV